MLTNDRKSEKWKIIYSKSSLLGKGQDVDMSARETSNASEQEIHLTAFFFYCNTQILGWLPSLPSPFSGKCLTNRAYIVQTPFLLGTHIWSEERLSQRRAFSQELTWGHQNSSARWMWEKAGHGKPGLPCTYMFQPKKIRLDRETRMRQTCSKQPRRETLQTVWGRGNLNSQLRSSWWLTHPLSRNSVRYLFNSE